MITVYFDLETGGLLDDHPITQLAAIAVDDQWNEVGQFEVKLIVRTEICEPEALKINNYRPEVWAAEAVFSQQGACEFRDFLNRFRCIHMVSKRSGREYSVARLASHNASFDAPRLKRWFADLNIFLPSHPHVKCTYQRAVWSLERPGYRRPADYKLNTLLAHFGQAISGDAHDALRDVRACILISRILENH